MGFKRVVEISKFWFWWEGTPTRRTEWRFIVRNSIPSEGKMPFNIHLQRAKATVDGRSTAFALQYVGSDHPDPTSKSARGGMFLGLAGA